jgi:hypothetical protein
MDQADDKKDRQVFMYGWFDKNNGGSAHVANPCDEGGGRFQLKLYVHNGISPHLKLHASVRTRDQDTNNVRTFPFAVSHADVLLMLQGKTDEFKMVDQFMEGNYVEVRIRVANSEDFQNHAACGTGLSGSGLKPLITFGPPVLDKVELSNQIMERISREMETGFSINHMSMSPGMETFRKGVTRSAAPLCNVSLFLMLMLGTPAYVHLLQS